MWIISKKAKKKSIHTLKPFVSRALAKEAISVSGAFFYLRVKFCTEESTKRHFKGDYYQCDRAHTIINNQCDRKYNQIAVNATAPQ